MTTYWIGPNHPSEDVGVFVFRCVLNLELLPDSLFVDLSADQRYKLYVNGELVAHGPQRGDLNRWFYDSIDLARYLRAGENEIQAVVWNFGWLAPIAQMGLRTGFVCRSEWPSLATPGAWEYARLDAWSFERMTAEPVDFYMEVGPGEIHDSRLPAPSEWKKPKVIADWRDRGSRYESIWAMTPRSIPPMRRDLRAKPPVVRRGSADALDGSLLLDFEELLCAYPVVVLAGDPGTTVTLTYDEGLWETTVAAGAYGSQAVKGHRDEVDGKEARGYQDKVILGDGPATFEPLWWRTFRYVTLESDGPARLISVDAVETGYPYRVGSSFEADEASVQPIWTTAVRTLERCAGETYFDCPYYEQLQYAGDTRLQVLAHYYLSSDRQLARNAITQLGDSLQANGLTQSRYPNRTTQFIPPFSLWWVMMLHDQMLYDGEASVEEHQQRLARLAIDSFTDLQRAESNQHWMFADWVPDWDAGVPPGGANATVQHLTRELANAALCDISGQQPSALGSFSSTGGLIRSHLDKDWQPSEHAEALFRLLQVARGQQPSSWPSAELRAANAAKTTLYFSYYKHLAMRPENYLAELGPWRQMIEDGLTTFAETPEPARSDCHAWSAHPVLGFFQIVAGITSISAGWRKARIAPNPGNLGRFNAEVVHPLGSISVRWEDQAFDISTPVPTEFIYGGITESLHPGRHRILL
jgi:hypothetical protein